MTTTDGTVFGLRCYAVSPDYPDPDLKARTKRITFIQYFVRAYRRCSYV
jgi:hypothetical protein